MTEWHFITGNSNKFNEAKQVFPSLVQKDLDLPEIQELDPRKVIAAKLEEARKHYQDRLIVEDVSLSVEALGGLPGTFIKWFLKALGPEGLAKVVANLESSKATARIVVGYCNEGEIAFAEDYLEGSIVMPRGDSGFGWDPIFQPSGQNKTLAQIKNKGGGGIRNKIFAELYEKLGGL